ncbi:MAG: HAD hydrolase family protein [Ruminococcaceae bacterium]|nr:HAD hydrolase family protein [Oscillospiraceae bacterium]
MSRRLIAFDIDGTVFYKGLPPSERLMRAFEERHKAGDIISVSTGRCRSIIPAPIRAQGFIDYMILSNGARTIDARTGETVSFTPLPHGEAARAFSLVTGRPSGCIYYESGIVMDRGGSIFIAYPKGATREEMAMIDEIRRETRLVFNAKKHLLKCGSPIEKISLFFRDKEKSKESCELLRENTALTVAFTYGEMELTANDVSKGRALVELSKKLDIKKEDVISFGDSGNDLSMKESSGCFVAMGNAEPFVKEAADIVAAPVWEDGVAGVLETL